ncbi:MAG: glutamate 5-kinase [Eubacteriaceae bacterium]|nr:glutamate 5-kinase [Eubacteriaceae bacterium]MDD4507446.1 glutamate 5-kinase [Eubacteriaceae bacterium]
MRNELKEAKIIVVKMGTTSLTHDNGIINLRKLDQLARILTDLENSGYRIVLVSSGAIGCGMHRLNMMSRPVTLEGKQVTAAVGQGLLMELYHRFFDSYHQNIGQILLTKDVFYHEIKRNNAKNTFCALLEREIIPVVNENDCISTDEIEEECFGDNDILSAMTANLIGAQALIILSDVEGLFNEDPSKNDNAVLIPLVKTVTSAIMKNGGSSGSGLGTGGMATKLGAAKYATEHGINTVVASGDCVDNLYHIMDGEEIGTLFLRQNEKLGDGKC